MAITAASPLVDMVIGVPISRPLSNDAANCVYSIPSGSILPPGLYINADNGILYGLPTTIGTYSFWFLERNTVTGVEAKQEYLVLVINSVGVGGGLSQAAVEAIALQAATDAADAALATALTAAATAEANAIAAAVVAADAAEAAAIAAANIAANDSARALIDATFQLGRVSPNQGVWFAESIDGLGRTILSVKTEHEGQERTIGSVTIP